MNSKKTENIRRIGLLMLFGAVLVLFIMVMGIRSLVYYHYRGPGYSLLFWIFPYCVIEGVGLLRLKKWAVIGLFLPGVLLGAIALYAIFKQPVLIPGLLTFAFVALVLGVPAMMLRHWKELRW